MQTHTHCFPLKTIFFHSISIVHTLYLPELCLSFFVVFCLPLFQRFFLPQLLIREPHTADTIPFCTLIGFPNIECHKDIHAKNNKTRVCIKHSHTIELLNTIFDFVSRMYFRITGQWMCLVQWTFKLYLYTCIRNMHNQTFN